MCFTLLPFQKGAAQSERDRELRKQAGTAYEMYRFSFRQAISQIPFPLTGCSPTKY